MSARKKPAAPEPIVPRIGDKVKMKGSDNRKARLALAWCGVAQYEADQK
jgi:hypothetical protein